MLHLIGLGLHDVTDITVKGLERVRACDRVVAEFYTARLMGTSQEELEAFLGCKVEILPREAVESGAPRLVESARGADVAFLTAGDPLAATTHTDLLVRCHEMGVQADVVHAPSIHTAAPGLAGLQHYRFGRTVTVPRPEGGWSPTSPMEPLLENLGRGLHTLVLLDIQAHRDYYMSASEGLRSLLEMATRLGTDAFGPDSPVAVVARAGAPDVRVRTGSVKDLADADHGPPLHCIIVPGTLHDVERAYWDMRA